jgi:hypothetical protein
MSWFGSYSPNDNIDVKFTTTGSTGAPTSLSAGSVAVYSGNSTTEDTSAVTLTADFDARTGLNNVRIASSAASTFYVAGGTYQVVITAGSVGGTPVNGYLVGAFDMRLPTFADAIIGRSASLSDATAQPYSIYTMIMAMFENQISGSTWTVYKSDGVTTHMTRGLSLASAGSLVTGVT